MRWKTLRIIAVSLALGGCAASDSKEDAQQPESAAPQPLPVPAQPRQIQIRIDASTDINPDATGRPSPVQLRIYQLKDVGTFNSADFFGIYDHELQVLGPDLVRKEELMVKPGSQIVIELKPQADTRFLGAFAAFRDLATAQWRGTALAPPNAAASIEITIKGSRLSARAQSQDGATGREH